MNRSNPRYICVLRWKPAEQLALAQFHASRVPSLVPLIEPTPRRLLARGHDTESLRSSLSTLAQELAISWLKRPFFLDPHLLAAATGAGRAAHIEQFLRAARFYSLSVVPVFGMGDSVKGLEGDTLAMLRSSPTAIRVRSDEVADSIGKLRLLDSLAANGFEPERTHLIYDRGNVQDAVLSTDLVLGLTNLCNWASITPLAGSFPRDLTGLDPGIHRLPRLEKIAYSKLLQAWPERAPVLNFGDFATQHAAFVEPPTPCFPSRSVRYALLEEWLVLRGYSSKTIKNADNQFIGHAKYLRGIPEFPSTPSCYGDDTSCRRPAQEFDPATSRRGSRLH